MWRHTTQHNDSLHNDCQSNCSVAEYSSNNSSIEGSNPNPGNGREIMGNKLVN